MSGEVRADHEPTDYGEVVGRCFLDKLLLAIIDGHPESSTSPASDIQRRKDRLRDAKQALLGQSHPEGRPPNSDEATLRWMGSERYKDLARRDMAKLKGERVPKPRSERKLIAQAIARFGHLESSGDRLRKKFGAQRQRWLDIAMLHDDVPEQIDFHLLTEIRDILAKRDIAMNLDRIER